MRYYNVYNSIIKNTNGTMQLIPYSKAKVKSFDEAITHGIETVDEINTKYNIENDRTMSSGFFIAKITKNSSYYRVWRYDFKKELLSLFRLAKCDLYKLETQIKIEEGDE